MKIETTINYTPCDETRASISLRVCDVASLFAGMDSEDQAKFFECVNDIAQTWREPAADLMQWQYVGQRLAKYDRRGALDMLRAIVAAADACE